MRPTVQFTAKSEAWVEYNSEIKSQKNPGILFQNFTCRLLCSNYDLCNGFPLYELLIG
jgi:hypothetical protein